MELVAVTEAARVLAMDQAGLFAEQRVPQEIQSAQGLGRQAYQFAKENNPRV